MHRIWKDEKVNKFWRKLFDQIRLNPKSRLVWEKEKHTIISQMSWAGSTPLSIYVGEIFNWRVSFKFLLKASCNCWEKTFNIACRMPPLKKELPKQQYESFWSNCSLIPLFLNKKWKRKHVMLWYLHITQKSLYSKQGSPIFLLFGSWSVVLHLYTWVKSKISRYF